MKLLSCVIVKMIIIIFYTFSTPDHNSLGGRGGGGPESGSVPMSLNGSFKHRHCTVLIDPRALYLLRFVS